MQKCFFIKTNGKYVKISFDEIVYVESCRNYLKIVTEVRTVLVLMSMKQMEQLLLAHSFIRIHRCYIVSLDHVSEFNRDIVFLKDKQLPIGGHYKGCLESAVNIITEENFNHPITVPFTYITKKAYAG